MRRDLLPIPRYADCSILISVSIWIITFQFLEHNVHAKREYGNENKAPPKYRLIHECVTSGSSRAFRKGASKSLDIFSAVQIAIGNIVEHKVFDVRSCNESINNVGEFRYRRR